jgi:LysM repeat protein
MGQLLQQRLKEIQAQQAAQETPSVAELEAASILEPHSPKSSFKAREFKPGDKYIWQKGDSLHDIATRGGTTLKTMMEFNEIEDWKELEEGVVLHFPTGSAGGRKIRHEALPEAIPMHVARPGGAKKWSYGNMKSFEDARSAGFFPQNTNVDIVVVAHVPITDENGTETEAAYYLDSVSAGDFATSGRVRYTVGYMWSDLEQGSIEKVRVVTPKRALQVSKIRAKMNEAEANLEATKAAAQIPEKELQFIEEQQQADQSRSFKEDYQALTDATGQPAPEECMAMIPKTIGKIDPEDGIRYIDIFDFDGRRPVRKLKQHQEITVYGTFPYKGDIYGRLSDHNWFAVKMLFVESQANVFDGETHITERAATGASLSFVERFFTEPLAKFVNNPRFRKHFQEIAANHIKNKKG